MDEPVEPVNEIVDKPVEPAESIEKVTQTIKIKRIMSSKQANALKAGRELYAKQREEYRQFALLNSKPKIEERDIGYHISFI